jgi:hypothetical protein
MCHGFRLYCPLFKCLFLRLLFALCDIQMTSPSKHLLKMIWHKLLRSEYFSEIQINLLFFNDFVSYKVLLNFSSEVSFEFGGDGRILFLSSKFIQQLP